MQLDQSMNFNSILQSTPASIDFWPQKIQDIFNPEGFQMLIRWWEDDKLWSPEQTKKVKSDIFNKLTLEQKNKIRISNPNEIGIENQLNWLNIYNKSQGNNRDPSKDLRLNWDGIIRIRSVITPLDRPQDATIAANNSLESTQKLSEEARLYYVNLNKAKDKLVDVSAFMSESTDKYLNSYINSWIWILSRTDWSKYATPQNTPNFANYTINLNNEKMESHRITMVWRSTLRMTKNER